MIKETILKQNEGEKYLLIGLVVDHLFYQQIKPIFDYKYLQTRFSKIVVGWCFEYHEKYGQAPQKIIQEIYASHKEQETYNETEMELVAKFLVSLNNFYTTSQFNRDYALDKTIDFLRERKIELLKADIQVSLINNRIEDAEELISKFNRVEKKQTEGLSIIRDEKKLKELYEQEDLDILFKFPGRIGELVGDFCRSEFVAVTGPAKRGKSWWLQEIGLQGLFAKLKVVFFSLEMTEKRMTSRIYQTIMGQTKQQESNLKIPYFDDRDKIRYAIETRTGLDYTQIERKRRAIKRQIGAGDFHLISYPAYSANVGQLKIHLDRLEREQNFIPDIIIIDYADILAPEHRGEYRHQIDHTWKTLRALAQERHCLVATGSHSNKTTFERNIKQSDLSEDARKMNHVSTMFALNQKPAEMEKNIMRIAILAKRHGRFSINNEVVVLQCLDIGKPLLDSRYKEEMEDQIE